MTELLVAGFLAGLLGSPHCVGMCGGFAGACARSASGAIAWHAGRLSTYASLGALAGFAGTTLRGPPWIPLALSAVLLIWFAGVLGGVFPQAGMKIPGVAWAGRTLVARSDVPSRFAFGMVTGLLPCGLVYMALGLAVSSGSPLIGALAMVAFGSGTIPALAALAGVVRRIASQRIWFRRGMAMLVLAAGMYSLATRAIRLHAGANVPHSDHEVMTR